MVFTKLVKIWSWCYFNKVIFCQLFWRIALIMQNHGRSAKKYGPIQQVSTSELHSITKPWPFRGWTLDLIVWIHPPSSKGHRYILVAVDYFTKWVEAIPLKFFLSRGYNKLHRTNIIFRFGIPRTLTLDLGTVFTGRKVVQYANSQNI